MAARTYLNVKEVFGQHGRTVIDRLTLSIELPAKHLRRDWHLQHVACELTMRVSVVNVSSAFKDLQEETNH